MSWPSGPADAAPRAGERPLRIAVHGVLAEGAGSGAGSFPLLLAGLLAQGHGVEYFGNPNYVQLPSLERLPNFRYHALRVATIEAAYRVFAGARTPYPAAVLAQLAHAAYQKAATTEIERRSARAPFDVVLATDVHALWPCALPVLSWPQSPPQTEVTALGEPATERLVRANWGARRYAAVRAFYAYKGLLARATLGCTDAYLCTTRWARDEWVRFGADPARTRLLPYALDLSAFHAVPSRAPDAPTLLWLGRAAPRKRLDLFLQAFRLLRARHPALRARLVGNLRADPFAASILAAHGAEPGLSVEDPVPRDRVPALLAAVDVLVQPSQNENFGFSVAEALAAGRPVVAGPTNGTREYAGHAGFAFDAYTPAAVADATAAALAAVHERGATLSEQARAAARQFDCAVVVERFVSIAREFAARPRA